MFDNPELLTIGLLFLVYLISSSVWIGRMAAQIEENRKDVQGVAAKNEKENANLKHDFELRAELNCTARQREWAATLEGISGQRSIVEKQTATEISRIFSALEKLEKKIDLLRSA